MSKVIRAFVAVEPPSVIVNIVSGVIDELRAEGVSGFRPVKQDAMDLTLKFLGGVECALIPAIAEAIETVTPGRCPFTIRLGEPGVFPASGAPRVFWVGLSGGLDNLRSLQLDVEDSVADLGFPRERRKFNPHLTVGRVGNQVPGRARERIAERLFTTRIPNESEFPVASVSLIQSRLMAAGYVYSRLASGSLR